MPSIGEDHREVTMTLWNAQNGTVNNDVITVWSNQCTHLNENFNKSRNLTKLFIF